MTEIDDNDDFPLDVARTVSSARAAAATIDIAASLRNIESHLSVLATLAERMLQHLESKGK